MSCGRQSIRRAPLRKCAAKTTVREQLSAFHSQIHTWHNVMWTQHPEDVSPSVSRVLSLIFRLFSVGRGMTEHDWSLKETSAAVYHGLLDAAHAAETSRPCRRQPDASLS